MTEDPFDTDVAIIGYGPSGVSAANFLASRGVKAIAFEREKDIYQRARAVTINDWTMRCYQSVGLDAALKGVMDETVALRCITYDGTELMHIRFPPGQIGHASSYSIYQPLMEQALRDGADRFSDHLDVRYGTDVVDVAQDPDGVTVTTTDVVTGSSAVLRARYALACDGGSSLTRERLGIPLLGDTLKTRWVVIDARVKRWWANRHILTFWSDKTRPVVDIALAMGNHRWELPLAPHESDGDFATHDQLWPLLQSMGVTPDDVEIHQHAFYSHHVRHAERWREGRVFLLGDAAHLMPPWAGQGMQSGVRDAFNLSWKLAEVLAGRLSETVLATYQTERAPDVERYTQIAVGLGRMVKQEFSPEEMAAMAPPPGEDPPPPAVLAAPVMEAGWLTGTASPTNALGRMIPQPSVAGVNGRMTLLDDLIGNGFVLLGDGVDPRDLLSPEQRTDWDGLQATYRAIRTGDQGSRGPDDIIDLNGALIGWLREYGARVVAVRPDRFIAATDKTGLSVPAM